jgi:hypothetical protein
VSPEWKKGGRPWKPSHEKARSKKKKGNDGEVVVVEGEEKEEE